jgi:acetolactate synthase-1/2/3 large subunit
MNVAQMLLRTLKNNGITQLFGIFGTDNTRVLKHCNEFGITPVVPRNEFATPMTAHGYSLLSGGKPAVLISIPGPGALLLLPGLLEAHVSGIPILSLVVDVPLGFQHTYRGYLHQVPEPGLAATFAAVSKEVSSVQSWEDIEHALQKFFLDIHSGNHAPHRSEEHV